MISLYKDDGIIIEYSLHLRSNLKEVVFKHRGKHYPYFIFQITHVQGVALIEKYNEKIGGFNKVLNGRY